MKKHIPFVDLTTQYQQIKPKITKAIDRVLSNGQYIQGEDVHLFEEEFASYIGGKYCIGLNSGTDALILGFKALGMKPGDEVLLPANTFIASALGATENDLKPVFVDINENDHGYNLDDLKKKITSKTKAIVVVHLYGKPDKLDEIQKLIKGKKIHLIEDACQAHGAYYKGKRVGTFGAFSAWSFYPGKNLGAYGDGGAIVTNDAKLAEQLRLLREYGQRVKYHHDILGVNTRLDTIQAAILRVKLGYLDRWTKQRQKAAALYSKLLTREVPEVIVPQEDADRKSVYHVYLIRTKKREKLMEYLKEKGIIALIHYPIPLHMQKAFKYLGYKKGDLPVVEQVSKEILSLPMFPEITSEQIEYVVHHIKTFYSL